MHELSCGDVLTGCEERLRAGTVVDLLRQLTAHAWHCHGLAQPHLPAVVTRQVVAGVQRVA